MFLYYRRWIEAVLLIVVLAACNRPTETQRTDVAVSSEVDYPLILYIDQPEDVTVPCSDGITGKVRVTLTTIAPGAADVLSVGTITESGPFSITVRCASSRTTETWRLGTVSSIGQDHVVISMFVQPLKQ